MITQFIVEPIVDAVLARTPFKELLARVREVQYALLPHNIEAKYLKAKGAYDQEHPEDWSKRMDKLVVESCSIGIWGRIKFV